MKIRSYFFRVLPPPGQYSMKLKTLNFSSIAPKNDVIQGQYSKRAILEGQYSRGNTRGLMHPGNARAKLNFVKFVGVRNTDPLFNSHRTPTY